MSLIRNIRALALAGAAFSLLATSGASAQGLFGDWGGGSYVGGGVGLGVGVGVGVGVGGYGGGYGYNGGGWGPGGAVGYDQGYYGGGAVQALTGVYGGGGYQRAAYSAADVYYQPSYNHHRHVSYGGSYERSYVVPQTVMRPIVRSHVVPVTTYRTYNTVHYQPVTQYHVVRKRCHCETIY